MKFIYTFTVFIILFTSAFSSAQSKKKFSNYNAGMSNAVLEQQAVDAINQKAEYEHWKERYTKAVILSDDWVTETNEYTGVIICRKLYMMLYGLWPDGKCKAVYFGFRQDYTGGGKYSKTLQYHSIGDMTDIECE
jgi:hypothetical protein